MKKVGLLLLMGFFVLVGCKPSEKEAGSSKTISSLEKTVSSLKEENISLSNQVEHYQGMIRKKDDTTGSSTSSEKTANQTKSYSLNESLDLTDGNKETVKLKVIEATTNQGAFPSHMINLDDYDTNKMVAVTIEYTNVAYGEAFLPLSQYFQAFDKEGKKITKVNQQNGQDRVDEGRTGTTQLFWELPDEGSQFNELEIDFVPVDKKVGTFSIQVTH